MGNLLFSPEGKIGKQAFQKGAVILLAVNFFLWPIWYLGVGVGLLAAFGSLLLIYCWRCLFVKRLRAAHKPAIWFLPIFLAFAFISYILGSMFLSALSPEMVQEIIKFQETADPKNPDGEMFWAFYDRMFKALAIPYAAAYLVTGAAIAFILNKNLDSDIP